MLIRGLQTWQGHSRCAILCRFVRQNYFEAKHICCRLEALLLADKLRSGVGKGALLNT